MKIMSIAGARPNFMKLAAISHAVEEYNREAQTAELIEHLIVHTGQHYDQKMSESFFVELGIPEPDVNLEVGSATHARQTAEIMKRFEPVLIQYLPDVLLVVGDVNSTIACALVASKIEYPREANRRRPVIVHVEAGLRSNDRDMPEEINRMLTDILSDLLFVTEESGLRNLRAEGVAQEKLCLVGNVMIDTLISHLEKAKSSDIRKQLSVSDNYGLVTLHRPSNVDSLDILESLVGVLVELSKDIQIVFPVHPRTKAKLLEFNLLRKLERENILLTSPQGYLDFLHLIAYAKLVITDSGGIQEETTYLKVPCVTLRNNTERPSTVDIGSNYLIGTRPEMILGTVRKILQGKGKECSRPLYWDGKAGRRIVEELVTYASSKAGAEKI